MTRRPTHWPNTRGLRILGVTYGLGSNNQDLVFNPEFFEPGEIQSQITNWCTIDQIPYAPGLDAYCHFLDEPALPYEIEIGEQELFVQGDLSRLEREGRDRRWSLLGNIGLFFRYALTAQERQGIFSLHASSIYKPLDDELIVVVGKAGAGKTVYLLEALARGYQIFSTEMTYFQVQAERLVFHRGALMDNIRVGSFVYDFPQAAERLELDLPQVEDPWEAKISVSLHGVTTEQADLINPKLSFIFPRIEAGRERAIVHDIAYPRTLTRLLFDSASEKIGGTTLLYEELPVTGLDSPALARARWEAVSQLVTGLDSPAHWEIKQARTILAGPKSSMEGIDR
ncbi:MAG: hypothetical protein PVG25_00785 [Anaerolineae bacterium]